MTDIKEILDLITNMNINRCAYTTYDLSVQECARQEIIKGLAQHYNIVYHINPASMTTFPVKSISNRA
jgi:hypothetical protein